MILCNKLSSAHHAINENEANTHVATKNGRTKFMSVSTHKPMPRRKKNPPNTKTHLTTCASVHHTIHRITRIAQPAADVSGVVAPAHLRGNATEWRRITFTGGPIVTACSGRWENPGQRGTGNRSAVQIKGEEECKG